MEGRGKEEGALPGLPLGSHRQAVGSQEKGRRRQRPRKGGLLLEGGGLCPSVAKDLSIVHGRSLPPTQCQQESPVCSKRRDFIQIKRFANWANPSSSGNVHGNRLTPVI